MNDSRIRLEGRLEKVEQTSAELEGALAAARRGDWAPLVWAATRQESPELVEASTAVQRLAEQDPSLTAALDRLWALVRQAEALANRRREKLRLPPLPLLPAVKELVDEKVVYRGRRGRRGLVTAGVIALYLVVMAAMLLSDHSWPIWSIPVLVIAAGRKPRWQPIDVTVTRRRVLLKHATVRLADVARATVTERPRATQELPYLLTLELKNGEREYERLPELDAALVEALRQGGVEVDTSQVAR